MDRFEKKLSDGYRVFLRGTQNIDGFAKDILPNGYRVYLRGTQNINRFAKDVLPKWI